MKFAERYTVMRNSFRTSAKAVLKDEQVKSLAASLTSAYNGKQLAGLQDPSNLFIKNNYVKKTKEASGFFEFIADIMSAE